MGKKKVKTKAKKKKRVMYFCRDCNCSGSLNYWRKIKGKKTCWSCGSNKIVLASKFKKVKTRLDFKVRACHDEISFGKNMHNNRKGFFVFIKKYDNSGMKRARVDLTKAKAKEIADWINEQLEIMK